MLHRYAAFAVLAIAIASSGAVAPATAAPALPDLMVSVASPPPTVASGGSFRVRSVVRNSGSATSRRSSVRLLLSSDRRAGRDRIVVVRTATALRPRTQSVAVSRVVVPSAIAVGTRLYVGVCADARGVVREARETNNCAFSTRSFRVVTPTGSSSTGSNSAADPSQTPIAEPSATPTAPGADLAPSPTAPPEAGTLDPDADGVTAAAGDCAPLDPVTYPGAPDRPDGDALDTNCDGIDGTIANSVFVSSEGSDAGDGSIAQPKRTVGAAVATAASGSRDVLVAAGTYEATGGVALADDVDVHGGYSSSDWSRSLVNVTTLRGGPQAVLADGDTGVLLQRLRIEGTLGLPHLSVYGIRAINGSAITAELLTVVAADAAKGPDGAAAGHAGRNGGPGGMAVQGTCDRQIVASGGAGGFSPAGRSGGSGGSGGYGSNRGTAGAWGSIGSSGGTGGASGNPGGDGTSGANGSAGAGGANGSGGSGAAFSTVWTARTGTDGVMGAPGNGGGGGGGGGGQTGTFVMDGTGNGGGGGGGGAEGGSGGNGGGGGGASISGYFVGSSLVVVRDSRFMSGSGGAGGNGRDGGTGGTGGVGFGGAQNCTAEVGAGGYGGNGGAGGSGGAGGGGAGGASIGVALAAGSTLTGADRVAASNGTAGSGGTGGRQPGGPTASSGAHGASIGILIT